MVQQKNSFKHLRKALKNSLSLRVALNEFHMQYRRTTLDLAIPHENFLLVVK